MVSFSAPLYLTVTALLEYLNPTILRLYSFAYIFVAVTLLFSSHQKAHCYDDHHQFPILGLPCSCDRSLIFFFNVNNAHIFLDIHHIWYVNSPLCVLHLTQRLRLPSYINFAKYAKINLPPPPPPPPPTYGLSGLEQFS